MLNAAATGDEYYPDCSEVKHVGHVCTQMNTTVTEGVLLAYVTQFCKPVRK